MPFCFSGRFCIVNDGEDWQPETIPFDTWIISNGCRIIARDSWTFREDPS